MARKRMIDPNIWCSEDVSKLSITARYLLIGMISNADDYGKGRANSSYLRSIIFPYDEIKSSAIEKALNEIEKNISVQFYSVNENQYYKFVNWSKWQKVDHPANSIIPEPEEQFASNSRGIRETFAPNIIENNINKNKVIKERESKEKEVIVANAPSSLKFVKPTLEEIEEYCKERQNGIDPQCFLDFYTAKGWKVGNQPMRDWKACVRTWEKRSNQNRGSPHSLTSDIQRVIEVMEEC